MTARSRYTTPIPKNSFPQKKKLQKFVFTALLLNGLLAKCSAVAAVAAWAAADSGASGLLPSAPKQSRQANSQAKQSNNITRVF